MRAAAALAVAGLLAGALTPVWGNSRADGSAFPLNHFEARYTVHKGIFRVAEARVRLQRQGERYVYSSRTEPVGVLALIRDDTVTERSIWEFHQGHIRPIEYRYIHEGSRKNRDAHLVFLWSEQRVSNTVQGHTWSMDIPKGTLDKFSVQLAVMLDLRRRRQPLRYSIADGGRLKTYRFDVLGREQVQTAAGEFEAIKLRRLRDDMERETYFWLAPGLDYLLVRVEHIEEDGSRFHLELDEVDGI